MKTRIKEYSIEASYFIFRDAPELGVHLDFGKADDRHLLLSKYLEDTKKLFLSRLGQYLESAPSDDLFAERKLKTLLEEILNAKRLRDESGKVD